MTQKLIERLDKEKMGIFGSEESTEAALQYAQEALGDVPRGHVVAVIMRYHNTLIEQVQALIKQEAA